jgi:hypothetical protein
MEEQKALEKIRQEYDHLITSYMKPMALKLEFEERYSQALRMRMDMEHFINGEIIMLQELFKREEKRVDKEEQEAQTREARHAKYGKQGYSGKVEEDLNKQIEKYTCLKIHHHAANEICRLFGAIKEFETQFWRGVEAFLANIFPSERNAALAQMDQTLWQCTYCRNGNVPIALERYVMMLDSRELYGDLLQESQSCIKEAAFLLHDIKNAIEASNDLHFDDERVSIAYDMIITVLTDFRLRDIKKQKGERLWQK